MRNRKLFLAIALSVTCVFLLVATSASSSSYAAQPAGKASWRPGFVYNGSSGVYATSGTYFSANYNGQNYSYANQTTNYAIKFDISNVNISQQNYFVRMSASKSTIFGNYNFSSYEEVAFNDSFFSLGFSLGINVTMLKDFNNRTIPTNDMAFNGMNATVATGVSVNIGTAKYTTDKLSEHSAHYNNYTGSYWNGTTWVYGEVYNTVISSSTFWFDSSSGLLVESVGFSAYYQNHSSGSGFGNGNVYHMELSSGSNPSSASTTIYYAGGVAAVAAAIGSVVYLSRRRKRAGGNP
ncbi:MAG: hypothetical protein ACYDAZ_06190 [Thermoplasmataceae archaeon]